MRLSRDPNFFFRAGEQPHLVMPTGVRICVPNLKRLLLLSAAAIRFLDFEYFDANMFLHGTQSYLGNHTYVCRRHFRLIRWRLILMMQLLFLIIVIYIFTKVMIVDAQPLDST